MDAGAAHDLPRGKPGGAGTRSLVVQYYDDRAGADPVWHRSAEAAVSAPRRQYRRLVVPGIFRAGRGIRPRLAEDCRQTQRRRLRRQWPEDLDLDGAPCRLVLLPRAHRPAGAEAPTGDLVPADRYEDAGHH